MTNADVFDVDRAAGAVGVLMTNADVFDVCPRIVMH
jgi:hypothetical protein